MKHCQTLLLMIVLFGSGATHAAATTIYGSNGTVRFPPSSIASLLPPVWWGPSFAAVLADDFRLASYSRLTSIDLWTYDTLDGPTGFLKDLHHAIYAGASPTGDPVASGFGTITTQNATGLYGVVPNFPGDMKIFSF